MHAAEKYVATNESIRKGAAYVVRNVIATSMPAVVANHHLPRILRLPIH